MTHFILNMHNAQKQHFILSWGGSINMFAHHKMYAKSYVWNLSKWRCCRIYRFLYNTVVQEIPASFYKLTTSSKTWICRSAQFFSSKITSEDKPNHLMDLEEAFLSLKERQSKISVYWVECKVSDTFWRMKFPHKMTLLEKEKPKIIWSGGTFCTDQMTTTLSLLVRKLISSDPVIFIAKT